MSERFVRMPSAETITKRLEATPLPLRQRRVLLRFIHSVANQEENAMTLVAAWEGACQEANRRLPLGVDLAIIRLLHAYAFPSVADVIMPDPQVAADAKAELRFRMETCA